MNRFEKVTEQIFKDTETDEKMIIYSLDQKRFLDLADEVQGGLNLIYSMKLRRGSKTTISKQEFLSIKSAFLAMERDDQHNKLIRDVVKLCDLITSHQEHIKFSS